MLTRFTPARCCCDAPDPQNPCPCLEGTLTASKNLNVSGFIMTDLRPPTQAFDINGVYTPFALGCSLLSGRTTGPPFQTGDISIDLDFTRNEVVNFFGTEVALPAGVKALFWAQQRTQIPSGPYESFRRTTALFYEVVADVDGYIDCSASFTSAVFHSQQSFIDEPGPDSSHVTEIFVASGGAVTYA